MDFHALFSDFGTETTTGLATGAVFALFALGYTLVYGVLRLINFAHSEVFMLGTFAAIGIWGVLGYTENSAAPGVGMLIVLLVVALVAAMLASGTTAVLLELVAYRPLRRRNAPPLAFLITAIGMSTILQEAVGVGVGRYSTHRNPVGAPVLIKPAVVLSFGNTKIYSYQVLLVVTALVMMYALDRFINTTRLGRGVRAVAQNPDAAALMGVNKNRVISLVFLLGGLMAGIAAVMYVIKIGNTSYNAGFQLGIEAFTAAVLGGIGNLRGALLGGFLLGVVENYGAALFGTQYHDVVAFVILVLILMFRPTGLLGESLGRTRA
ncbi:MAG TPA: branched-chain amino acid ABC transporter permease [Micromonosporaceae bacterium]|nr:branched-chain amino acid ABC transporter permease [Micromonosporaceae bacterium]